MKRVTSWLGPSPYHCACRQHSSSRGNCRSGGVLLPTLCPVLPARDFYLRPSTPKTKVLPLNRLAQLFSTGVRGRDGTGQDFLEPNGKFQNHHRLTGRSTGRLTGFWPPRSTGFFTESFMYLVKSFQKGGMGEGLKFVTLDGGLRKKNAKNFWVFCKNDLIFRPFLVKFLFEWPVLSSAKRAQNKHKKHWRAQAKSLDVLCHDILQKAKKWSYKFLAVGDRLFAICRAANTKLFFRSAAFAVTKRWEKK